MTRILVFGTFDMVHEGHTNMFQQARSLAGDPYLIVSLARDKNVEKIKGQPPRNSEEIRAQILRECNLVDEVVFGDVDGYLPHILAAKPDIIALGYDQEGQYVQNLAKDLKTAGCSATIVRLNPFQPEKFKTSKLAGDA